MTRSSTDADPAPVLAGLLVASAAMLALLTALNLAALDRYAPAGAPLRILPPEGLTLANADPGGVARVDLPVPLAAADGLVRIEAEAEGFDIAPGPRPWQRGRIVFLRRDAGGRALWDLPHVLALLKENPVRTAFSDVFRGDGRAASLTVRLELLRATGRLEVHSVTATPMRAAHGAEAASAALMAGWLALALAATWWVWGRVRRRRWLIGFAWAVAASAMVLSVLPAAATAPARAVTVGAVDLVASDAASPQEREAAISANSFSIAKSGHVIMFLAVGFAFGLARGRSGVLPVLALAVAYAILCEALQAFSPNRSPSLFDAHLNAASAFAGCLAGVAALRAYRRWGV